MSVHALSSCSFQISLLKGLGATRNVMTRLSNEAIASDMTAAGINVTDAPFLYTQISRPNLINSALITQTVRTNLSRSYLRHRRCWKSSVGG